MRDKLRELANKLLMMSIKTDLTYIPGLTQGYYLSRISTDLRQLNLRLLELMEARKRKKNLEALITYVTK